MQEKHRNKVYPLANGGQIVIDQPMTQEEADGIIAAAKSNIAGRCQIGDGYFKLLSDEVDRLISEQAEE